MLISEFDRIETDNKIEIVPYIRSFRKRLPPNSDYQHCRTFFVGFKITDALALEKVDVFYCVRKFILDVSKQAKLNSAGKRKTNVAVYSAKRNEILEAGDLIRADEEDEGLKHSGEALATATRKRIKVNMLDKI